MKNEIGIQLLEVEDATIFVGRDQIDWTKDAEGGAAIQEETRKTEKLHGRSEEDSEGVVTLKGREEEDDPAVSKDYLWLIHKMWCTAFLNRQ